MMRRYLDIFDVGALSIGLSALGWLLVVVAEHVGIPQIDPSLRTDRPLETLATIVMTVPVAGLAQALTVRLPWLVMGAARSMWPVRLTWLLLQVSLGSALAWFAAEASGGPARSFVASWLTLSAVTVVSVICIPRALTPLPAIVVVLLLSFASGFPPFAANILYNPALADRTTIGALIVHAFAGAAYAWRGDRATWHQAGG